MYICVIQGFANLSDLILNLVEQALVEIVLECHIVPGCSGCMLSKDNNV